MVRSPELRPGGRAAVRAAVQGAQAGGGVFIERC